MAASDLETVDALIAVAWPKAEKGDGEHMDRVMRLLEMRPVYRQQPRTGPNLDGQELRIIDALIEAERPRADAGDGESMDRVMRLLELRQVYRSQEKPKP